MANGIFTDRPFEPNPKCLLFGAAIMALYWFSPSKKNPLLLPPLFIGSYVGMAWYDYKYNCDTKLKSGRAPISVAALDTPFKPQYRDTTAYPHSEQEQLYRRNTSLMHVGVVAPVLVATAYIARWRPKLLPVVGALGLGAFAYHGYRLIEPRKGC